MSSSTTEIRAITKPSDVYISAVGGKIYYTLVVARQV